MQRLVRLLLAAVVCPGCSGGSGDSPQIDGGIDVVDMHVDGAVSHVDGGPTIDFAPWTRTIGAASSFYGASAVRIDGSGNVVVTGSGAGNLPFATTTAVATYDADSHPLIAKYDNQGNLAFATRTVDDKQSATAGTTTASGAIYIVGAAPPTAGGAGMQDVFLRKYDAPGTAVWSRSFGSSEDDTVTAVATDSTGNAVCVGGVNAAIAGQTSGTYSDSFARMYDASGNVVWTRQFAAATEEAAYGVAIDPAGNSFVVGTGATVTDPQGPRSNYYAYVRKLDASGATVWSEELAGGTGLAIAIDPSGNVLVAGWLNGTINGFTSAGANDAFVWKLDATGNTAWTRQFGTSGSDYATGLATDAQGNVFVGGYSDGTFEGQTSAGATDGFLRKYAADGTIAWTKQFGSDVQDTVASVATDQGGNIYIAGTANGALPGGQDLGFNSAFVIKFPPQ